jgi:hypothetical protein
VALKKLNVWMAIGSSCANRVQGRPLEDLSIQQPPYQTCTYNLTALPRLTYCRTDPHSLLQLWNLSLSRPFDHPSHRRCQLTSCVPRPFSPALLYGCKNSERPSSSGSAPELKLEHASFEYSNAYTCPHPLPPKAPAHLRLQACDTDSSLAHSSPLI